MNYALRHNSHWQGEGLGPVIDVFATRREAEALEDFMSTCSFCFPGRSSGYSAGVCYKVKPTRRPVTAEVDPTDEISLQDYMDALCEREYA